jgi:hypothetical protein
LHLDIGEIGNGDIIYVPVLMNGSEWHYLNPSPDERVFLTAFEIRRERRSDYQPSLAQRLREADASKPALRTIPVRR